MRIIGDVHGKVSEYLKIVEGAKASIQVGDMSFDYSQIPTSEKHKFIYGNHDKHPDVINHKNCIGSFGQNFTEEGSYFFLSGAFSIDYKFRTEGVSWWKDEEVSTRLYDSVKKTYSYFKPNVVITHTPPQFIIDQVCDPNILKNYLITPEEAKSRTAKLLDELFFGEHKPKFWFFGHLHKSFSVEANGTNFIGLNELEYVDFNLRKLKFEEVKNA